MPFNTIVRVSLLCALCATAAVSQSQVYRWVDEKGQTHFGSQPPREYLRDANAYEVKVSPAKTTPDKPASNDQKPGQQAGAEGKNAANGAQVSPEQAAEYCQQSREYLNTLNSDFSRRYKIPDSEEVRPLTDAERARERNNAQQMISAYCKQ